MELTNNEKRIINGLFKDIKGTTRKYYADGDLCG